MGDVPAKNQLHFGDCLEVMKSSVIPSESIDLIYLDPPFNSNASYNVLFKSPKGHKSDAQIHAFEDTWHWGETAEKEYLELLNQPHNAKLSDAIAALRSILGENDMMAYLVMMANRLLEMHGDLKPTGSLYLHCDPTASHYLKVLLDTIFGVENFRNEISWRRSSAHSDSKQGMKRCGRIRDVLLFYTKSNEYTWNTIYTPYDLEYLESEYRHVDESGRRYKEADLTAAKPGGDTEYDWWVKRRAGSKERWQADLTDEHETPKSGWDYLPARPYNGRYWAYSKANLVEFVRQGKIVHRETGVPRLKLFAEEMPGIPLQDSWDDINPASGDEDLGYPTQKPLALLERIIAASSKPGDVVLDPFCGCGTAIHAAQKLGRCWIGIDITHLAVNLIDKRMRDAFPGIEFEIHGTPKDYGGARQLAENDKYEFQWWALSLVDARPYAGKKKGADEGIDGIIFFLDDGTHVAKKIVVSVKGGARKHVDVKEIMATVEQHKAQMGFLISLDEPSDQMTKVAATAGFYTSPSGSKFPKIQILSIKGLMDGTERPRYPSLDHGAVTFQKAQVEHGTDKQQDLFSGGGKIAKTKGARTQPSAK